MNILKSLILTSLIAWILRRGAKEFCVISILLPISLIPQALGFTSNEPSIQKMSNLGADSSIGNGSSPSNFIEMENQSSQLEQTSPTETVGWQTYEDGEDGYKMQYPQEWKTSKPIFPGLKTGFAITADEDPAAELKETLVSVYVTKASRTLDPGTLKMQSIPLEQYANDAIQEMTSSKGEPTVLKNEAITLNGQPAWRVDYIHNYLGAQLNYGTDIFVTKGDKLYTVSLWLNPLKVEEMRPVGEKIIQTFQFTNNTDQSN